MAEAKTVVSVTFQVAASQDVTWNTISKHFPGAPKSSVVKYESNLNTFLERCVTGFKSIWPEAAVEVVGTHCQLFVESKDASLVITTDNWESVKSQLPYMFGQKAGLRCKFIFTPTSLKLKKGSTHTDNTRVNLQHPHAHTRTHNTCTL